VPCASRMRIGKLGLSISSSAKLLFKKDLCIKRGKERKFG
jgi:hypothetical protein